MILFVFEGEKREKVIFNTIKQIFFKKTQTFVYCYCSNIYSLYQEMKTLDVFGDAADIFTLLKKRNNSLLQNYNSADFSEIYLFFDYDAIEANLADCNTEVKELLEYFCNETDKGKLYINYPMVESIRYYKKQLPDPDYYKYTVCVTVGKDFKYLADQDSIYKNLDFLCSKIKKHADLNQNNYEKIGRELTEEEINKFKQNWIHIIKLNVCKANYICNNLNAIPSSKEDISQSEIFGSQLLKYIEPSGEIAILNSFPLFIYEDLKEISS